MNVKVLGTRKLDFKTDKGDQVAGTQIFMCYPLNGVDGYFVDKVFVPANSSVTLPTFKYGEEYQFIYQGIGRRQILTDIVAVG